MPGTTPGTTFFGRAALVRKRCPPDLTLFENYFMKRSFALILLAPLALIVGAGCSSGNSKVEFKVTLNGTAVEGATVTLHPQEGTDAAGVPSGVTDAAGIALISTGEKAGAAKGKYKVTVSKSEAIQGMSDMSPIEAMKRQSGLAGGAKGPGAGAGIANQPKLLTPARYGDPLETPFTVEVPTSGQQVLAMEGAAGADVKPKPQR